MRKREPMDVSPVGTFALSIEECRTLLAKLTAHVEDYLGHHADDVTWGHVADADRVLYCLRHAAFAAGIGEEPSR